LRADNDLYVRGTATLLASWEEYARSSPGAALERLNGVSAGVFPSYPERAVYNNALLDRDLGPTERAAAVDAMDPRTTPRASTATPHGSTRVTRECAPS
jgi:hypothetical protein